MVCPQSLFPLGRNRSVAAQSGAAQRARCKPADSPSLNLLADLQILPTTEVGSNDSIRKAKTSARPESERKSPFPNRLKKAGGPRTE